MGESGGRERQNARYQLLNGKKCVNGGRKLEGGGDRIIVQRYRQKETKWRLREVQKLFSKSVRQTKQRN